MVSFCEDFLIGGSNIHVKKGVQFKRNLSFFKVPEGVQLFPGGSNC